MKRSNPEKCCNFVATFQTKQFAIILFKVRPTLQDTLRNVQFVFASRKIGPFFLCRFVNCRSESVWTDVKAALCFLLLTLRVALRLDVEQL